MGEANPPTSEHLLALLAARVLAEIGDDRTRFADARALKSYAGSAPITRASGKKRFVGRHFVKTNRLMHSGSLWSFSALQASPGANTHYRRGREHGDWHNAAQRHLLDRFLGQLHHCLQTRQPFDEQRAVAPPLQASSCPGGGMGAEVPGDRERSWAQANRRITPLRQHKYRYSYDGTVWQLS